MSVMIGVYPGFQEIELKPGQNYEGSFYVINTSESSTEKVKYRLIALPYSEISESINTDSDFMKEHLRIADWIEFDNATGEIAPETKQLVKYKVKVPENATAGGQYGAIVVRIGEETEETGSGIHISAIYQVANIIYGTVDGDLTYSGNIIENNIKNVLLGAPVTASSVVENTGNIHTDIKTTLQVFSLFSDEEIYTNENRNIPNIVIPGSKKETVNTWDSTPALGVYRVVQTVAVAGDVSTESGIVFIAPIWFIVAWVAFFASCIAWIFTRKHSRKHLLKKRSAVSHKSVTR